MVSPAIPYASADAKEPEPGDRLCSADRAFVAACENPYVLAALYPKANAKHMSLVLADAKKKPFGRN